MSDCNAEQHQESQRQDLPLAMDQLAIEKAGNIPGWKPYLYDSTKQGLRVTGCLTTEFSRGPRKGETKYLTSEKRISVILTREELRAFVPRPCRIQLRRSKGWRLPANSVKGRKSRLLTKQWPFSSTASQGSWTRSRGRKTSAASWREKIRRAGVSTDLPVMRMCCSR